jgi:two-component system, NtrC family, response regulator AtoC
VGTLPTPSRDARVTAINPGPTNPDSAELRILVVEDDPEVTEMIGAGLAGSGHEAHFATDGAEALERLQQAAYDLVLSDIRLPEVDGLTLLHWVVENLPSTRVVLMSAFGTVAEAVGAMKARAADYLPKPFELDQLLALVAQVAHDRAVRGLLVRAAETIGLDEPDEERIVGDSLVMTQLRQRIAAIARSTAAVIITGESGTGKELIARAVHRLSGRRGKFVAVNCAAFPETLLEAELFGHERGAFTGAVRRRAGRFEAAHEGTLFLDEIGEMAPTAQAKLLRVLQEGAFEPLGTNSPVHVDVRVVSATNVDLLDRVRRGLFREDLYYRLKVFHLHAPPLRERRADLPLLVQHFWRLITGNSDAQKISPRAWAALTHYSYPGNVRELRHALEHALILAVDGEIDLDHLPDEIRGLDPTEGGPGDMLPLARALREFEREYLVRAVRECGGNLDEAARVLQIPAGGLESRLHRLGLELGERAAEDPQLPAAGNGAPG